ncbi:MAG: MarR family transcriptional regulator [Desulfurococcales archaeon]|nr:MarR family transcriptional regulator [Desulfurococcales archaeon]
MTGAGRVLLALSRAPEGLTYSELERETGLSSASLTINLQRLMAEGLVARDGRRYRLTPQGRARVESLVLEVAGGG